MRFSGACLASLAVLSTLAAASPAPDATASFSFDGPSALDGRLHGACEAVGIVVPSAVAGVVLDARRATLVERTILLNQTSAALGGQDYATEEPERMDESSIELPPGRILIEAGPSPLMTALLTDFSSAPLPTIQVEWTGIHADRSAFEAGRPAPGEHVWVSDGVGLRDRAPGFPDPTQAVRVNGSAVAGGAFLLYLREVRILAGDVDRPVRPYTRVVFEAGAPVASHRRIEVSDAFLHLTDARWILPAAAEILCTHGRTSVDGEFIAEGASGAIEGGGRRVTFDRRALNLAGQFLLEEGPAPGGAHATAVGDLRAVALDFAVVPAPTGPSALTVVGWAAAVSLTTLTLVKWAGTIVGFFYSRFGRDSVLDNRGREVVFQAVDANPGIDLTELGTLTSMHRATVTYHVRVLARVGLVATVRRGRSVRVLRRELMNARDLPKVLTAREPGLARLQALLANGERPLRDIALRLADELVLTPRAAYDFVDRAVQLGLARRYEIDREVYIACVAS